MFQIRRNGKIPNTAFGWTGAVAALFFASSGVTILFQMALALTVTPLVSEVVVTLVLAVIPVALGIGVLRFSLNKAKVNRRRRAYMIILGVIAILAWAGWFIGSALAIIASMLPAKSTA